MSMQGDKYNDELRAGQMCHECGADLLPADPRIDLLGGAAILTSTQIRLAFAPIDPADPVVALKASALSARLIDMQSRMRLGRVHLQIKEGFADERRIELSGPELFLLMELADRLVTEMPK